MEDELLAEELALLIEEWEARNPGQRSPLRDAPAPKPQVEPVSSTGPEVFPSISDIPPLPQEGLPEPAPEEQPSPAEVKPEGTLSWMTRPLRQIGAATSGGVYAALPKLIGTMAQTPSAAETYFPGLEGVVEQVGPRVPHQPFEDVAEDIMQQAKKTWGVPGPAQTPVEEFSANIPKAVNPAGKYTALMTLLGAGAHTASDILSGKSDIPEQLASLLGGPAQAETLEETLRKNQGRRGKPAALEDVLRANQGAVRPDEKPKTYGLKQRKGSKNVPAETDEEFAMRVEKKRLEREQAAKTFTPSAEELIANIERRKAGQIEEPSAGLLAGLIGGTVAAAAVPIIGRNAIAAFRTVHVPRMRPVIDAPPGTMAISTPGHIARMADDATATSLGIAETAGVPVAEIRRLQQTARVETRHGQRALIDEAIENGRMRSVNFNFTAPTSLGQIRRMSTPESDEYIHLLNAGEQLTVALGTRAQQLRLQGSTSAQAAAGPPTYAGMDFNQVSQRIFALEQAHPEVRQVAQAYREWIVARRSMEATGEHATLRARNPNWNNPGRADRSEQWLNANRRYEVPDEGLGPETPLARRGSPIDLQESYSRRRMADRMDNEYRNPLVNAVEGTHGGRLARRTTVEELNERPEMKPNTIRTYHRGEPVYRVMDPTLADSLQMDPVGIVSTTGQAVYAVKRTAEFVLTGLGNPQFSFVDAGRLWMQSLVTTPPGFRRITPWGIVAAVPRQLAPQAARWFAQNLEAGSGGTLSRWLGGRQGVDRLTQWLHQQYDLSRFAEFSRAGGTAGSMLAQPSAMTNAQLARGHQLATRIPGPFRNFWEAYASTIRSIHEAPGFAFAARNYGRTVRGRRVTTPELMVESRRLGGDPRVTGQYHIQPRDPISGLAGTPRPARYIGPHQRTARVAQAYGATADALRNAAPWFNVTEQAIKRVGQAYWDNPIRFMRDMWIYPGGLTAAAYYWNYSLGNDPNGVPYVDHQVYRRNPYNSQMNLYVGVPGLPAEAGIEISAFPQEFTFHKRMFELGLHHILGREKVFDQYDDFKRAAIGLLDVSIDPAVPSIASMWEASRGFIPSRGFVAGEPYKIRNDPYPEHGGLPNSLELMARQLSGGIGQTIGAGAAAFQSTDDGQFLEALQNAGKGMLRVQAERTPGVSMLTGIRPPISGTTDITRELFKRQRVINDLSDNFDAMQKAGTIETKGASLGGEKVAERLLGPPVSGESPAPPKKPPTNPLYITYMQEVRDHFRKESPNAISGEDKGGFGFKSLLRRRGDATAVLKDLGRVNEGNNVSWQKWLSERDNVRAELQNAKVDTTNLVQVKNYYLRKKHDTERVLLYSMFAVEDKLSEAVGAPVTIFDLDPYGQGIKGQGGVPISE